VYETATEILKHVKKFMLQMVALLFLTKHATKYCKIWYTFMNRRLWIVTQNIFWQYLVETWIVAYYRL